MLVMSSISYMNRGTVVQLNKVTLISKTNLKNKQEIYSVINCLNSSGKIKLLFWSRITILENFETYWILIEKISYINKPRVHKLYHMKLLIKDFNNETKKDEKINNHSHKKSPIINYCL